LIHLTLNPSIDDWPHPKSLSRGERDFMKSRNSVLQTLPFSPGRRGRGMRLFLQMAGG